MLEKSDNISFVGANALINLSGKMDDPKNMQYTTPEKLEKKGAKVYMETEAVDVDLEKKVVVACKNAREFEIEFDKLILATGSTPRLPSVEGVHLNNIQTMKFLSDGVNLIDRVHSDKIKRIGIVGSGYIGVETAVAIREYSQDKEIMLFGSSDIPLNKYLDERFALIVKDLFKKHNITVLAERAVGFLGDSNVCAIVGERKDKSRVEHGVDLVVLSAGFVPNSSLLAGKVERIEPSLAYKVNQYAQTSVPFVYAVGDCASSFNTVTQKHIYLPLGSYATRSGLIAGNNVPTNNADSAGLGTQCSSSVNVFDTDFCATGLTYEQSVREFQDVGFSDFIATEKPKFLVGESNAPVLCRLIFHKKTYRLLGAELASEYDVSLMLHMLSLAIQKQVSIKELRYIDMFFSPLQNQVYNYVQHNAQRAVHNNNATT
jgi:NADPH-dependent 2,4-dienoyl-CoA reductase/sulfur reductase-like enzyme